MVLRALITILVILILTSFYSCIIKEDGQEEKIKWEEIFLFDFFINGTGYDYRATSELDDVGDYEFGQYGAHNLFDSHSSTCWAEGASGDGIGEYIFIGIDEKMKQICIVNGYAKAKETFIKNNRVKKLKVSLYIGINKPGYVTELAIIYDAAKYKKDKIIRLKDKKEVQHFEFPFDWEKIIQFKESSRKSFIKEHKKELKESDIKESELTIQYILKLEIVDVYKGSKYDDTCISDIWFIYE
ncbi:hypothetical protein KAX75_00400 [candidate division WOR-3 bacterium]|nr:hypothetical protein [candidate division WOR-3 bacterium]